MSAKSKILQMLILFAAIIILAITPLGYLRVSDVLELTFIGVPVIVGAVLLDPICGGILGLAFGISSFLLVPENPLYGMFYEDHKALFFMACVIPRVLTGVFAGISSRILSKYDRAGYLNYITSSLIGCITNSIAFCALLYYLMVEPIIDATDMTVEAFKEMVFDIFAANAFLECLACALLVTLITQAINAYRKGALE